MPESIHASEVQLAPPEIAPFISEISTHIQAQLSTFSTDRSADTFPHLLVALSGGIDSVVLLHAMRQLAGPLHFRLSAMHVHHGLSTQADDWWAFCQTLCEQWSVPFYGQRVHVDTASGLGIEAAARAVRYAALSDIMQTIQADLLVTAHHVQDQSETLLLQLLRGAGVKGLSGMAVSDTTRKLLRPMLGIQKAQIKQYAASYQLRWVEDESNLDTRYERNFLRSSILPALRTRYPHVDSTLARSAEHLADAQVLLDVLAAQDLQACQLQAEWMGQSIALDTFYALGEIRGKNLLRGWFQQQQLSMPTREQLHAYWQQLVTVQPHRYLHLPLTDRCGEVRVFLHHYQGRLYCVRKPSALPEMPLIWSGEAIQRWGDWQLTFKLVKGRGIALARLGISPAEITLHLRYGRRMTVAADKSLLIHARTGGESLQPDAKRPRRELKVIFQMLGIPPWQRAFYPLASLQMPQSDTATLIGLLPSTINAAWRPGRNAYGIEIQFSPLS